MVCKDAFECHCRGAGAEVAATLRTALASRAVAKILAKLPASSRGDNEPALGAALREMLGAAMLDVGGQAVVGPLLCLPGAVSGLLSIIQVGHDCWLHLEQCLVFCVACAGQAARLSIPSGELAGNLPFSCKPEMPQWRPMLPYDLWDCKICSCMPASFLCVHANSLLQHLHSTALRCYLDVMFSGCLISMLLQDPIQEAVEGLLDAGSGSAQTAPVWRPAALYAAALLGEVGRVTHADALARCSPWAPHIKAAIQAANDSPLVQQPGKPLDASGSR